MDGLLGFVLAGFALAGSPGPATLSLAAAGAAFGARRGLALYDGHRRRHGGGDGDHGDRRERARAGAAGRGPGRGRRWPPPTSSTSPSASRTAPPLGGDAATERRRPSFVGGVFLGSSTRRATPRWRPCVSGFVLVRGASRAGTSAAKRDRAAAIMHAVDLGWLLRGSGAHALDRAPRRPRDQLASPASVAFARSPAASHSRRCAAAPTARSSRHPPGVKGRVRAAPGPGPGQARASLWTSVG